MSIQNALLGLLHRRVIAEIDVQSRPERGIIRDCTAMQFTSLVRLCTIDLVGEVFSKELDSAADLRDAERRGVTSGAGVVADRMQLAA